MRLAAFALLAALLPHPADATTVGIHAVSLHGSRAYETVTPGLYVRTDSGVTLGVLRNSHGRMGTYVAQTWERRGWALTVGGITGYERAAVVPLVVPSYRFDSGLRVAVLPNPWERRGSAIHFSWEWSAK